MSTSSTTPSTTSRKGGCGKKNKAHKPRSSSPHKVNTACGGAGLRADAKAPGKQASVTQANRGTSLAPRTASATKAWPHVSIHPRQSYNVAMRSQ